MDNLYSKKQSVPIYKHPLFWGLLIFVGLLIVGFGGGLLITRFLLPK